MTPFDCFTEDIAEGRHNLGTDQLRVALSNTAPDAADTVIGDIVEIDYTHCSSRDVTVSSSSQTDGVYTLVLEDLVLTATGGNVGPFRYVVLYNSTASGGRLIGRVDLGAEKTILGSGEAPTTLEAQLFIADGTWTSPATVVGTAVVNIGGGGARGLVNTGGGGGGARAGLDAFEFAAATGYAVVRGAGGTTDGSPGTNGTFNGTACVAEGGGQDGTWNHGGRASACVGDWAFDGGNGATGTGAQTGGGSAGSAGSASANLPGEPDGCYAISNNNVAYGAGGRCTATGSNNGANNWCRVEWPEGSDGIFSDVVATTANRDTADVTEREIVAPPAPQIGDRWRLFIGCDGNPTITLSDWTLIEDDANGTNCKGAIYEHVYAGVTPDLTITTSAAERVNWRLVSERNSAALTATSANNIGVIDPPEHAPGAGDYRWYCFVVMNPQGTLNSLTTIPSGYDRGWLAPLDHQNGVSILVLYRKASGSSENPGTMSAATSGWVAITAASGRAA